MPYNTSSYTHDEQKRAQRVVRHTEHYPHFQQQPEQNWNHNAPISAQRGTVTSSMALLGNPNLGARSNSHVRIAVMQRMQSTYGNRATRHFVQRARQSSPVVVQRGVFGWLRKQFRKLKHKGKKRETPPQAAEAQERTGTQYEGLPKATTSTPYVGIPGQTAGQPQPQPEAEAGTIEGAETLALPAAGTTRLWQPTRPTPVAVTGGTATTAPALPAATAATLGVTTPATAAQPVNMAQKQVVKYSLLKSLYPDPQHIGEEQHSPIAMNVYKERSDELGDLWNQLEEAEQNLMAARSQNNQFLLHQWAARYKDLENQYLNKYNEFNDWMTLNQVDPNEMHEYKVKYLHSEAEREEYELKGGNPIKQGTPPNDRVYDTSNAFSVFSGSGWAIYVMAADGKIYAGTHRVSRFHHSSFLAGGDVAGAGEIKVENGKLTGITNKSGHYRPGPEHLAQVLKEFRERGANLSGVYLKLFFTDAQGNVNVDDSRDAAGFLQYEEQRMARKAGGGPAVVR